jgi:pimeloyl-ACP methyl ester carboxylesterase
LENLPVSAALLSEAGYPQGKPIVFLSASTSPQRRRDEHAALAARLPLARHVTAAQSNHWIMQDQPELILQAIQHILAVSRASHPDSLAKSPVLKNTVRGTE